MASIIFIRWKSISVTSTSLCPKLIRSFSISNPSNLFENSLQKRRLRDETNFNKRRRPPKFNIPLHNDPLGLDFLERFKLGFQNTTKGHKIIPEEPAVPEDADEIFKKMKKTGFFTIFVAMFDGLCKDGLLQQATKLYGSMREKGTIPEEVIYTAVVEGFCKAHRFDDAIRIFRKMQKDSIEPNAFSYGVLVQGLCKGRRLEDAVEFCVEMLESGHPPNLATFVGLVDGFCRVKGLEDAKSLIVTLKQKGFFYDEKGAREYLDKKVPFLPLVWEAIVGKKASQRSSFFD